jgi:peptide/nickel transport system ATP-binding protein
VSCDGPGGPTVPMGDIGPVDAGPVARSGQKRSPGPRPAVAEPARAPRLLEVRDLRLAYETQRGPLRAVDGISLDLLAGEALGIIGESGSGKSSLALALMRLLPRNATVEGGSMRLAGEELGSLSDEAFRVGVRWSRMAMVFQGAMHSLNPVVRVADQVGERLRADGRPRREVEARVRELLARVGLPAGTGRRYPHELSGGMKQRVMIAAALTHDPPLLILDEPTSALDVSIQAQIMNLLKELKAERRMAMLFVTHDLALASDLCDHLAVVYAGQVREHGTAEQVLRQPLDPYTQGLLASIPSLVETRPPRFLPGAPPDLRDAPPGCRFAPRCPLVFEACRGEAPRLRTADGSPAGAGTDASEAHVARCLLLDPAHADAAARVSASRASRSRDVPATDAPTHVAAGPPPGAGEPFGRPEGGSPVRQDAGHGALLELEALSVTFVVRSSLFASRPVAAVREVTLSLARGETVALVGESGSGKTTLGRATLKLVPSGGGRIRFEGLDLASLEGRELRAFRQRAQAIFQDPFSSLSPYMRVGELVEEPLVIHGPGSRSQRIERVLGALEQVKLSPAAEFAEAYPHALSGGQRQRVSIARAMILGPEYLVADEPVSMIDASSRAEILALMKDLQGSRGLTFLYITHDLASARQFADRIAVMYAGRIVELASATTLVSSALHPYTRALLAAVPEPDPANRLRQRPVVGGEPPDPGALPGGCAFHPRCPMAMAGTCDRIDPPLVEVRPGHAVACHLYPAGESPEPGTDGMVRPAQDAHAAADPPG